MVSNKSDSNGFINYIMNIILYNSILWMYVYYYVFKMKLLPLYYKDFILLVYILRQINKLKKNSHWLARLLFPNSFPIFPQFDSSFLKSCRDKLL